MRKLQFISILIMIVLCVAPVRVYAVATIYDADKPGWQAAVGAWLTEDFEDGVVGPGLSVVSTNGVVYTQASGNKLWSDDLTYDVINKEPTAWTTWTFDVPIHAFGGTWDLGSYRTDPTIGGPGSNIEVLINGSWVSVGVIDKSYIDVFWGFVSDVPFEKVRLQAYNDEGLRERYTLDDMVYSALEQYLTGGGQIVAGEGKRKDQYVVSFSGNLGYTGDLTLIGQYQFNLHNVSVDDLDGAIFHSTEVTELDFYKDDGDGPAPPPAYSNVAYFAIEGRLKTKGSQFEDGYTIYAYVADRGEPGDEDSINFALWQGPVLLYSATWDFPAESQVETPGVTLTTYLDAGNLQIHSE